MTHLRPSWRLLGVALTVAWLGLAAGRVRADQIVVNFDNLSGQTAVPNGYGGINWGGVWTYYGWPQSPYNPHSGAYRVYTPSTGSGEYQFAFVTPDQTFQGAWFAGLFGYVEFRLYDDGVLVHTSKQLWVNEVPTFLASGYDGHVDAVGVYASNNDQYAMDDVTYGVKQVPEPATAWLAGLGTLGLLAAYRRRRKRHHLADNP